MYLGFEKGDLPTQEIGRLVPELETLLRNVNVSFSHILLTGDRTWLVEGVPRRDERIAQIAVRRWLKYTQGMGVKFSVMTDGVVSEIHIMPKKPLVINPMAKFNYKVTGARGAVYKTTTIGEAREVAGKSGVIEPIGRTRNPRKKLNVKVFPERGEKDFIRFSFDDIGFEKLATVFPEMQGVDWLKESGGDSFHFSMLKGGESGNDPDRWDAWVWWEDKENSLAVAINSEGFDVDTSNWIAEATVEPIRYQRVVNNRALAWKRTRNLPWKSKRRFDGKKEVLAVLQAYFNSIPVGPIQNPAPRKNALLTVQDAVRLLQTLPMNVADNVHEVAVRRVGTKHYIIDGTRYDVSEAANIVANKGCK